MPRSLTLMEDAELVAELHQYGHKVSMPHNSHLPEHERREAAAAEPEHPSGLCREARERQALRVQLHECRHHPTVHGRTDPVTADIIYPDDISDEEAAHLRALVEKQRQREREG